MKWVFTGGGTGGHIYPALEVAREVQEQGASVRYLGSLRGQESRLAAQRQIAFVGFPSQPLWSLKTPAGWKSLVWLLRSTVLAKAELKTNRPDVVFSTGGYGAAPVVHAARSLRIPYAIHEANSMPGRVNRMFAQQALALTCSFNATLTVLPNAVRTGQPIRKELREASVGVGLGDGSFLVLGGSQGSQYLNQLVVEAARTDTQLQGVLVTGRDNFESVSRLAEGLESRLEVLPYLEASELASAYRRCSTVIARSGGTLAEIAMFRRPSALVPLPTSADDHQLKNAQEFVGMGAAMLVPQSGNSATPKAVAELASAVVALSASDYRAKAIAQLGEWDRPDATQSIVRLVFDRLSPN